MESLENLSDLFVHELRDLYDAEQQLIKALPLLAQAAASEQLRQSFEEHVEETKEQARRLDQIFKAMNESPEGKPCKAMAGLVAEAREILDADADPDVLDAALIVASQKVEHYEIAGYGSARTFARVLNYGDAARMLETTLKEESRLDERLTRLAERLNQKAETADQAAT
jgi:ferritin-like metal-binding protein YciE